MPPAKSNKKLSSRDIEVFKRWIEQGAKWQDHWSFIKPTSSPLPKVSNRTWAKNGIDYFSLAHGMGLSWEVTFHPGVTTAQAAMARAEQDVMRHAGSNDAETEIVPGFYEWGDEFVYAVLKVGGEPGGEFFFARYGATTVSLSLSGVYFFEGAQFHQLVDRALSNLLFYHPEAAHE